MDTGKYKHKHKYEVVGEYQSKGKNLLGETVECTMEKVICIDCNESNIRRKA